MGGAPCCCCTLQTGTKVVAIVNIVFSVIAAIVNILGFFAIGALGVTAYSKNENQDNDKAFAAAGIVLLIIGILTIAFVVGFLVVCIVLLLGANARHHGKCKIWFIVTIVIVALWTVRDLYATVKIGQMHGAGEAFTSLLSLIFGLAIAGYELWVVYAFMEEIKDESAPAGQAGYVHAKQNEEA